LGNTTFFKGLVEPMSIKKTVKSKRPLVRVGGFLGIGGKKVDAIEYYTKLFDDLDKIVMDRRSSPNFEMTNVAFVTFESMSSAVSWFMSYKLLNKLILLFLDNCNPNRN